MHHWINCIASHLMRIHKCVWSNVGKLLPLAHIKSSPCLHWNRIWLHLLSSFLFGRPLARFMQTTGSDRCLHSETEGWFIGSRLLRNSGIFTQDALSSWMDSSSSDVLVSFAGASYPHLLRLRLHLHASKVLWRPGNWFNFCTAAELFSQCNVASEVASRIGGSKRTLNA